MNGLRTSSTHPLTEELVKASLAEFFIFWMKLLMLVSLQIDHDHSCGVTNQVGSPQPINTPKVMGCYFFFKNIKSISSMYMSINDMVFLTPITISYTTCLLYY